MAGPGHRLQGGPDQAAGAAPVRGGEARGRVRHQRLPRDRAAVGGAPGDPAGPGGEVCAVPQPVNTPQYRSCLCLSGHHSSVLAILLNVDSDCDDVYDTNV